MLFDLLSNDSAWTDYGINLPDQTTAKQVHKFLREALLDRHIYVTKVTAFKFDMTEHITASRKCTVGRKVVVGESYPEVLNNLQNKVFYRTGASSAIADLGTGVNSLDSVAFQFRGSELPVLYDNPYLCRVIKGTGKLHVKLVWDCGFRDMNANSHKFESRENTDYFPCYTDFSLNEFFRIPPMAQNSTMVCIRCYHNASLDAFRMMLVKWLHANNRAKLREEERQWLSNCGL